MLKILCNIEKMKYKSMRGLNQRPLLLRCPKVANHLGRGQLLTAAPSSPSLYHPQDALGDDADNSRAVVNHTNIGSKSAKKVKKKSTPCGVLFLFVFYTIKDEHYIFIFRSLV